MPLERERRWSRTYRHPTKRIGHHISRFMDGSASISFVELRTEWPRLSLRDRTDFCQNAAWLRGQHDFADMLRFVIREAGPEEWSAIALSVASALPRDEAFQILSDCLNATDPAHASNLLQAVARTGHEAAPSIIRAHLDKLTSRPTLWDNDKFMNWMTFTAVCAIKYLLELGAEPSEFEQLVRALSAHPCEACRDSCRRFLGARYPWLPSAKPHDDGPG